MALELQQIKECDGGCCKASPRFPNADNTDCLYRTEVNQSKGCSLMADTSPIDGKVSIADSNMTAIEVFDLTCKNWPHNQTPKLGKTGAECCWQWVEA